MFLQHLAELTLNRKCLSVLTGALKMQTYGNSLFKRKKKQTDGLYGHHYRCSGGGGGRGKQML